MVGTKKKHQKGPPKSFFPQTPKNLENLPWRKIFFRNFFFEHLGAPQGPYWEDPRWWAQKKRSKKVVYNHFSPIWTPKNPKNPLAVPKMPEKNFKHLGGPHIPPKKLFRWWAERNLAKKLVTISCSPRNHSVTTVLSSQLLGVSFSTELLLP